VFCIFYRGQIKRNCVSSIKVLTAVLMKI